MTIQLDTLQIVMGLIVGVASVVGIVFGAVRGIAKPTISELIEKHLHDCPVRTGLDQERKDRQEAVARIEMAVDRIVDRIDDLMKLITTRGA